MSIFPEIDFILRDQVDGTEITPKTIGLHRFNEFNTQVEIFLAGSEGQNLEEVHVQVGEGSYRLSATLTEAVASALEPDLLVLQRQDSLGEIDPKRAHILSKWQAQSKANPRIRYSIRPRFAGNLSVDLNVETDFRIGEVIPWVKVERYLSGVVMDMGGTHKANLHLRLDDSGQVIRIATNQTYLKEQQKNYLYRRILVRIEAEQHFRTRQLRNLRLLAFESYEPSLDENALDRFTNAGRIAWADVPDAAKWVRQIRGGT